VHWHEGLGVYVAVSHQACDTLLRDRLLGRIWRDREPAEQFPAFNLLHRTSILENEPPTHTRLRRLVADLADLADGLDADGSADRLALVAEPVPVEVIAELLPDGRTGRARCRMPPCC
jgi:hypothetical protein